MAYKKDQGRMARMAVFWSLAILVFYGCTSLHETLVGNWDEALGTPLAGRIPVLGLDVNGALLISVVVFAGALAFLYRWSEKPKNADLLIETETELRKVTWPTADEAVKSSVVVVLTVTFLMVFLAGADWAIGEWASRILTGK